MAVHMGPAHMQEAKNTTRTSWRVYAVAVAGPILLVVGLVQYFGSPRHLIAALDGQLLLVNKSQLMVTGEEAEIARFQIENISGDELRIVGCRSSCRCVAATSLPATIASGAKIDLDFKVVGASDKQIDESVTLFTVPAGTPVTLRVVASH